VVGCSGNGFNGGLLFWQRYWWWWFLVFGVLVAAAWGWFSGYFDFLITFKSVEICRNLCIWLTSIAPVVTDFPRVMSIFASWSCYWILMGRLILLRDRKLGFSDNFLGWVDVFLGFGEFVLVFIFGVPFICDTSIM
jgi:hypothetical protein